MAHYIETYLKTSLEVGLTKYFFIGRFNKNILFSELIVLLFIFQQIVRNESNTYRYDKVINVIIIYEIDEFKINLTKSN